MINQKNGNQIQEIIEKWKNTGLKKWTISNTWGKI